MRKAYRHNRPHCVRVESFSTRQRVEVWRVKTKAVWKRDGEKSNRWAGMTLHGGKLDTVNQKSPFRGSESGINNA